MMMMWLGLLILVLVFLAGRGVFLGIELFDDVAKEVGKKGIKSAKIKAGD